MAQALLVYSISLGIQLLHSLPNTNANTLDGNTIRHRLIRDFGFLGDCLLPDCDL